MIRTRPDDEFLAAATDGLKHDPELQLDVRAELCSHLEERRSAAEGAGLTPDTADAEALRAMGPAAELAADLERANLRRMRRRSLVRLAAQWLLAPLAVAVALLTTDWRAFRALPLLRAMSGSGSGGPEFAEPRWNLSPDQRLVLDGDRTRPNRVEQQKAIWERWPTNRVYLQNYVTHLLSDYSQLGTTAAEQYAALSAEIARLQPLDPDNARFDYILAGKLLDQAVETKTRQVKGPDGKDKTEYDFTVKDRARLDEAMARLQAGLAKPELRRYTRELAVERMSILGKPDSLLQQISQIGMLAGLLLPDLSYLRNLQRTSVFYGELLAGEGKREEADAFLNAYRRLIPQINHDGFTLIDVLVVGALAAYAEDHVPAFYEKMGDADAAERARRETALLAGPIKEWKARLKAGGESPAGKAWETDLKKHGGILAGLLLPAIGEYPSVEELTPSRNLEYVVAEGFALAALSVILFAVMLGCAVAAFYYRRIRGGGPFTLLLLPEPGEVARLMGLGVLLPLLLYYGVTRWIPSAGRDLNLSFGMVPLEAQLVALLLVMLGTLSGLAARLVRRRCRELLLLVPPPVHGFWIVTRGVALSGLGFLAVAGGAWNFKEGEWERILLGLFIVLLVLTELVRRIVRDVKHGRSCAAYYGSLARTLLPVVAIALILVNISSRPYLRMAERRLLAADTLMCLDPNGGFTAIESRLTHRLTAEMQKAAEDMGKGSLP